MFSMIKTHRMTLVPFSENYLRVLVEKNLSNYFTWFIDSEVTKYNSHGLFPQSVKDRKDFFDDIENKKRLVLAMLVDACHIGNISLQSFDWINRSAELAIVIGETKYHGLGYGKEACYHICEHGFNKMNLHRIWSGTSALNIGMQKIFEKLGFTHEGTFKKAQFLEGAYHDVYEYGLLNGELKNYE